MGPLERRLFLTVLVGLLPLIVLSSATLIYNAQRQKQQVIEASDGTMRAIFTAVESELRMSLASLDALASSPRLAADDFVGLHKEAVELLQRRP
ncbi:MAG: chemotaxis protein methyltransferase CheR, partial [Paucimonas sp.]|nr:chemotaxis protein methyltransferase CheR [Paucimonas sp.]